jgi:predicted nucleotidyltransferase
VHVTVPGSDREYPWFTTLTGTQRTRNGHVGARGALVLPSRATVGSWVVEGKPTRTAGSVSDRSPEAVRQLLGSKSICDHPRVHRADILLVGMNGTSQISLLQRARWALHQTGWLSPTHDILPAVSAALVTYVVTLITAPRGTPVDRRAVGFPLAAGVVALAVTFIVINLIELSVKCVKAGPRLRIEGDIQRQDSLIATAQDTTFKDWLTQQFGRTEFHVCLAAVFGSVTRAYPTRDVDVVVQIESTSDRHIRKLGLRLKELGRTFEAEFGLPLHLQLFASTETNELLDFAVRAGSLDILIGGEYWAEISVPNTSRSSESE